MGATSDEATGNVPTPLVRAKLRPPGVPPHYVRRARLLSLVHEAVTASLTLVVAPAGSGKTMLLAGWTAEAASPTAWLALDDSDREPAHLWKGIISALEVLAPGCGEEARTMLRGPSTVVEAVCQLVDDLDGLSNPVSVLVVDDLHMVDADPVVADTLALFLQHLPPWLHAVVASRRDPALPLDRLRARGLLTEIRYAELRFTRDEAHDLLTQLGPSLPDDKVDAAVARADGWAASLQLVALAARSARASDEVVAFSHGDDALIQDYIVNEVLAAEEQDLVDVLADVAVVDRISPGLARALTGRPNVRDLLRQAEARGLFVTHLPAPGSFELHGLVRAALVAEAAAKAPDRLGERHARAARWYEDAGETVLALEHWLLADRPRDALRLVAAEHTSLYDDGREGVVRRTIAAIPVDVASADLGAMLEFTWGHLLVDRQRFIDLVEELTWWADRPGTDAGLRPRVTMLQSIRAAVGGRWGDGGMLARQAITTMGDGWWRDPLGRFGWNMVSHEVALSERWDEAGDDVRQAELALSVDPERRLWFEGTRALGIALAGHPVDALRVAAAVRRAAIATEMTILRLELGVAEAIAHREIGDRSRALGELEAHARTPAGSLLYCQVLAGTELVQAYLEQGDIAAARDELRQIEALVTAEEFGPDGIGWVARAGTLVALAEGSIGEARRWTDLVDDAFWAPVCAARVDLAVGARADAAAALERAAPRCVRHRVVRAALRARAAQDREGSLREVEYAVGQAAAAGLLQTVASEGPEVVQLVERAADRAPEEWIDRLRRAATPTGQVPEGGCEPVAALTGRERDVLRLLAGRLTVREIAAELYVSPNTLKFHLKTIYRKLGVGSRAEAAEVARRMAAVQPRSASST